MDENFILNRWEEIKTIVTDLDLDVAKNVSGNAAAGLRTRKGLRALSKACTSLVKEVLAKDKAAKAERPKHEKVAK
jgi:hypothetical protein